MSGHPPIHLCTYPPSYQSLHPPIYLFICVSIHLFIPSTHSPTYLSILSHMHQFHSPVIHSSTHQSIYPPIYPSTHPWIHLILEQPPRSKFLPSFTKLISIFRFPIYCPIDRTGDLRILTLGYESDKFPFRGALGTPHSRVAPSPSHKDPAASQDPCLLLEAGDPQRGAFASCPQLCLLGPENRSSIKEGPAKLKMENRLSAAKERLAETAWIKGRLGCPGPQHGVWLSNLHLAESLLLTLLEGRKVQPRTGNPVQYGWDLTPPRMTPAICVFSL